MSQGSECSRSAPLWCHHGCRAEVLLEPPLLVSDVSTPCRGSIHRPSGACTSLLGLREQRPPLWVSHCSGETWQALASTLVPAPEPLGPLGWTGSEGLLWNLKYSRHSHDIPGPVSQPDPGLILVLTLTKGPVSQSMERARNLRGPGVQHQDPEALKPFQWGM